jgi:hypothetical protein
MLLAQLTKLGKDLVVEHAGFRLALEGVAFLFQILKGRTDEDAKCAGDEEYGVGPGR